MAKSSDSLDPDVLLRSLNALVALRNEPTEKDHPEWRAQRDEEISMWNGR